MTSRHFKRSVRLLVFPGAAVVIVATVATTVHLVQQANDGMSSVRDCSRQTVAVGCSRKGST